MLSWAALADDYKGQWYWATKQSPKLGWGLVVLFPSGYLSWNVGADSPPRAQLFFLCLLPPWGCLIVLTAQWLAYPQSKGKGKGTASTAFLWLVLDTDIFWLCFIGSESLSLVSDSRQMNQAPCVKDKWFLKCKHGLCRLELDKNVH